MKSIYMGIDLAWKEENPSGLAVIDSRGEIVHCTSAPYLDRDFSRFINEYNEKVVLSVDSPLQVKNEEGGRSCDSLLMRHPFNGQHLKVFATSRTYMNRHYGGVRGERLLKLLEEECGFVLGKNLVETFPTGIVQSLYPYLREKKYKLSSGGKLIDLKRNFSLLIRALKDSGFTGNFPDPKSAETRKDYKKLEDQIDGILCAVNSWYFGKLKSFVQFGEGENGLTVIAEPLQSHSKKSDR